MFLLTRQHCRQIGAVMIIRYHPALLERELQERNQCHGIIGRN